MLQTSTTGQMRRALSSIFEAAVAAAHPAGRLAAVLPPPPRGRLIVLAAGKAAGSMSAAAEAHYLDGLGLPRERFAGLAVARHGYGAPTRAIEMVEAGHPVPDAAGLAATARALALAEGAGADDLVLVLLSGGGSANWVAPAAGLTLADKQAVNRALLRSGAAIDEINTVRKRLSRIKGGRLAVAAFPAPVVTLAISDVPGDAPAVIASGPTVPDPTTSADARAIVARRGLELAPAVRRLLDDPAQETPKADHPAFTIGRYVMIANPAEALAAAEAEARRLGYRTVSLGADLEGEAREVAAEQARLALKLQGEIGGAGRPVALISGGELTVTLKGQGRGGPNQEFALALALALDGAPRIAALSGDTDGTDGGGGEPTDPAGAVIDETTLARARALGLDPAAMLADNDSTGFFAPLGDLLQPGPTLTNVNDCRVILIEPA